MKKLLGFPVVISDAVPVVDIVFGDFRDYITSIPAILAPAPHGYNLLDYETFCMDMYGDYYGRKDGTGWTKLEKL